MKNKHDQGFSLVEILVECSIVLCIFFGVYIVETICIFLKTEVYEDFIGAETALIELCESSVAKIKTNDRAVAGVDLNIILTEELLCKEDGNFVTDKLTFAVLLTVYVFIKTVAGESGVADREEMLDTLYLIRGCLCGD